MDDSINEFARNLMARAKARDEGILKRHDNLTAPSATPSASSTSASIEKVMLETKSMEEDVPPPPSKSNKENLERTDVEMEEEEEEEEEDSYNNEEEEMEQEAENDNQQQRGEEEEEEDESEDEVEEEDTKEERADELVPLSLLASKPLARAIGNKGPHQSASPISRKTRLSALAQSINSWEDDLATPPKKEAADYAPTTGGGGGSGKKKGPRFSISTPPPPTTRLASAQANKRNSCHQFIAATSVVTSPVKSSPLVDDRSSPAKTPCSASGPTSGNSSFSSVLSSSSPTKQGLTNSSPIKNVSSPKKKITQSPVKAVKDIEERKMASPIRSQNLLQPGKVASPVKSFAAEEAGDEAIKNLEMQGYVKVDPSQGPPTSSAPKKGGMIAGSILNKKRMFEKDVDTSSAAVPPAPKVSKTTNWPQVSASSALASSSSSTNQTVSSASAATAATTTKMTPLQQFHSRKSLAQVDPSELSVAQKARLFERQQKEQEQLRSKEQETNKWLNRGPTNKNVAAAPLPQQQQQQPKKATTNIQKSPVKSKQPEEVLSDDKQQPKKFYFGEKYTIPPPPPPPLPETPLLSSPKKKKTIVSPTKKILVNNQDADDENMESNSGDEDDNNCSPSMLIAKSVKPIRRGVVTKDDKMYPSLTDLENNTETEEDNETNTSSVGSSPVASFSFNSSMSTSSLGSFIQTKAQCTTTQSEVNTTMACQQIDDLIDQALEGQIVDDTFMMEGAVPLQSSSPIVKHVPQPLMHSVSVYRKNQQQQKKADNDSAFKVPQNLEVLEEENEDDKEALHDRIQALEQQVLIQQKAIAQASKALNVCESSFEFNNSTENIEGERVLLIASQKRSQLLSFISKLRSGKNIQDGGGVSPSKDKFKPSSSTKGVMKIDSLQLIPVKSARLHQDYVYHFIMILKYNDQVFATTTVKTSASNTCIEFPNEFIIPELDPGFKVQVEVYALRTFKQMDVIPHNMKYHIKNPLTPQSGSGSTPSKGSTLSNFLTPTRSSKHTPKATDLKSTPSSGAAMASFNSIRSSNFTLQAVLNLNLSNLNKTEWEMSMVNSNLILPNISMSIKCNNKNELNFRGFLTVFSDISGLGAWHRRWAMLDEDFRLLFWTYPEDEGQKPPVHTVALSSCITPRIAPVVRDVCARPHTFLLVTTREPLPTDADSLVVSVHEKYTAIKNMFSADNKSERDAWIAVINKALTNMRAWGINEQIIKGK